MTLDGRFATDDFVGRHASFQNVQAHHIAYGVMQNQSEEVELHDPVQALGKFVEKRWQVALLGDGFADLQQSLQLAPRMVRVARFARFPQVQQRGPP